MNPFKEFDDILKNHISDKAIYELPLRWSEKTRFYHSTDHLIQIIQDIEKDSRFKHLNVYEKQALLLAAFFHDVIYDPKREDNEDKSIEYFIRSYKGKDVKMLDKVCDLIETTKHRKKPIDNLKQIFWSADNAKLRGRFEDLKKNEELIRKEYSFVPKNEYKEKRIKFFNSCIGLFGVSTDTNLKKFIAYLDKKY
jgi:pantetheine-phosphate adenylyltransferase